jgi:protocatechuate 3,4-dioxygenase beta subunit
VSHPEYEPLTTQIYFEGDKYNRLDPWWKASLTIPLERHVDPETGRSEYRGIFDGHRIVADSHPRYETEPQAAETREGD